MKTHKMNKTKKEREKLKNERNVNLHNRLNDDRFFRRFFMGNYS
jgi:hypothetical protein